MSSIGGGGGGGGNVGGGRGIVPEKIKTNTKMM